MRIYPIIMSAGRVNIALTLDIWHKRRNFTPPKKLFESDWEYLVWAHGFYNSEIEKVNNSENDTRWYKEHFVFTLGYVKPKTLKDRLRNSIRKFLPK